MPGPAITMLMSSPIRFAPYGGCEPAQVSEDAHYRGVRHRLMKYFVPNSVVRGFEPQNRPYGDPSTGSRKNAL